MNKVPKQVRNLVKNEKKNKKTSYNITNITIQYIKLNTSLNILPVTGHQ